MAAGEVWWASQDSVSSGEDDPRRVGGMLAEAVVGDGEDFIFRYVNERTRDLFLCSLWVKTDLGCT